MLGRCCLDAPSTPYLYTVRYLDTNSEQQELHTESLAVTNPTRRTSQACLQTPSVSIRVCWESGNQKPVRDHFRAGRILNICTMVFCRSVRYDTRSQPEVDKYSLGLALCELNPTLEPKLTVQLEPTQIPGSVSDLVTRLLAQRAHTAHFRRDKNISNSKLHHGAEVPQREILRAEHRLHD